MLNKWRWSSSSIELGPFCIFLSKKKDKDDVESHIIGKKKRHRWQERGVTQLSLVRLNDDTRETEKDTKTSTTNSLVVKDMVL
jgi:hypothetical protein